MLVLAIPIALIGTGALASVFDSEVSIHFNDNKGLFKGHVDSTSECEAGRKVVVFKARKGDDKKIGSDMTNAQGKWKVDKNHANGKYYAKVKKSTLAGYASAPGDTCAADRSKKIHV